MTPQPVNGAGAVDLAGIKNAPNEEQVAAMIHQALGQLGLVCDCGNLIERGGQEILMVSVGIVPGPNGAPQRGMGINKKAFCSATCENYGLFKAAALSGDTLVVVSRPIQTNFWFKKPNEPVSQDEMIKQDLAEDYGVDPDELEVQDAS